MCIWTETDLDSIIFCFKLLHLFTAEVQSRRISALHEADLFFLCLLFTFYECISSFDHLLTLCFLAQGQKPGPYVKEMNDAAMFYTNRVLKDYKDTLVDCFCMCLVQVDMFN